MGTEDVAGRSKQWKKVRKKAEISVCVGGGTQRKMLVATAFIVSLTHGVVADVNRNKQCSLPISSLLTVSGITTAGALFWRSGSHGSSLRRRVAFDE